MHLIRSAILATVAACALACPGVALAELVPVRYPEGFSHGFLALKNPAGITVASGDFFSTTRGNRVTTHLVYRFKDGSIDDELTVFSQHGHFQLISDHHVQKGPAFEQPIDTTIVVATGKVTVRYPDDHGAEKTEVAQLELPADLANGMLIALLKNVQPSALPPSVSYLATTPKPRLVKLEIAAAPPDRFVVAGSARRATHYVLKAKIGGVSGLIAPLVGKQPPDIHVWIAGGEAPAFLRAEAPLSPDGPLFRTELIAPVWR
jgi:hypothetical protein